MKLLFYSSPYDYYADNLRPLVVQQLLQEMRYMVLILMI